MKRLEREHGRILSVETKFRGDALVEDALAGATTLIVGDAGDFDEDGGWLTINGQVVEYTECDDDEGTITLAEGLSAAADQGDAVHLYSKFYKEAVDYQEILVELDGEYDNPESVVAELAEGVDDLPEGDRGEAGESCVLLRVSDDEWEVVNVGGRPKSSAGMQAEADDAYTITAADVTAGTATMTLSHTPIDESVKGFWGVLPQEPTEYTVSGNTVTWPLDGVAVEGDRLWAHYWYRVEGLTPNATTTLDGLVLRGYVSTDNVSSVALPASTQIGDLLVVMACGANAGGKNDKLAVGAMTDPRATGHYSHPSGDDWWGVVTDLSNFQISVPLGGRVILATFGDTGGATPLGVDEAVSVTRSTADGNATETINVPSLPVAGVVLCITNDFGFGGSGASALPGYTAIAAANEMQMQFWTGDAPSPALAYENAESYQCYDWTVTTLPVEVV